MPEAFFCLRHFSGEKPDKADRHNQHSTPHLPDSGGRPAYGFMIRSSSISMRRLTASGSCPARSSLTLGMACGRNREVLALNPINSPWGRGLVGPISTPITLPEATEENESS